MKIRIRRTVAHFPVPFRLGSVEGLFPQGAYAVDVHEGSPAGEPAPPSGRLMVFIYLALVSDGKWMLRPVPVTNAEIAKAILEDGEAVASSGDFY